MSRKRKSARREAVTQAAQATTVARAEGSQAHLDRRASWPEWTHGITHPKKRAFLVAYAQTGSVTAAAERVGIERWTHYDWLRKDEGYAEAFKHAQELATDLLEEEARRRAFEGWDEPVYQKGQLVGTVRKYSDTLLIFLLKGARPERYRERVDVGSEPGRPLAVQVSDADAEAAARLVAEFARQQGGKAESGEGP